MAGSASKALLALKVIFYLVVIAGVALWAYGLYETRGEWSYRIAGAPEASYTPPYTLHVAVPLQVYDPAGPVTAKLVYYEVYINGYPAGEGLIPYINLEKGWNNMTISVDIDLSRASCGLAHALASNENITIRVKGYAMVDIKTFGGLTFKTITVPFDKVAKNVAAPKLGSPASDLLKIYDAICSNPQILGRLTEALAHLQQGGGISLP